MGLNAEYRQRHFSLGGKVWLREVLDSKAREYSCVIELPCMVAACKPTQARKGASRHELNGRDYSLETFRGDLFGGVTSAVVTLPVALAFGVATGLGAAAGLYGAIGVGFFAAVFGGTRTQISGPTGPMTIAMAVAITTHASTPGEAFAVVVLGGLIQVLLGVLRMGRSCPFSGCLPSPAAPWRFCGRFPMRWRT